jgi:hypothetical protein
MQQRRVVLTGEVCLGKLTSRSITLLEMIRAGFQRYMYNKSDVRTSSHCHTSVKRAVCSDVDAPAKASTLKI